MPKIRLTQVAVDRLKPPVSGRVEYWDTTLPAFGLRVAAARAGQPARKTWMCSYRVAGKKVRETLGTTATIPKVDDARDLARASMQKAQRGVHPVEERKRTAAADANGRGQPLAAAIERYLARYAAKRMRPVYFNETRRAFNYDVNPVLGDRLIGEVTRADIRELLEKIVERGSPSFANHLLAYLRAFLNWAVANDLIAVNPCNGIKMPARKGERDRALEDREIRLFWHGCEAIGWPFGPLFQLLLLTAQRRSELTDARWSEFNLDKALWTLPRERAKNDRAHLIALSPPAVAILRSLPQIGGDSFIFTTTGDSPISGFSKAGERLQTAMLELHKAELIDGGRRGEAEKANIEHFTPHDLRRTAATGMAALGIAPHVVDRILNHANGTISGVARIYNRHEYLAERQTALLMWARHIEMLVEPPNVVTIARVR
jgi:integrase